MTYTTCPHCGKAIDDDDALECLYCGESLDIPVGVFGKLRYPATRFIFFAVLIVVIISFIAVMAL